MTRASPKIADNADISTVNNDPETALFENELLYALIFFTSEYCATYRRRHLPTRIIFAPTREGSRQFLHCRDMPTAAIVAICPQTIPPPLCTTRRDAARCFAVRRSSRAAAACCQPHSENNHPQNGLPTPVLQYAAFITPRRLCHHTFSR